MIIFGEFQREIFAQVHCQTIINANFIASVKVHSLDDNKMITK